MIDMSKVSIAIGMPNGGTIKTNTLMCLMDAIPQVKCERHLVMPIGGYSHNSRNMVVDKATEYKATHIMFIDNDMIFPPDGIKKLIEHDFDIVAANYHERGFPLTSTLKFIDNKGELRKGLESDFSKTVFKCFAAGTGFMLIKMKVFEKLKKPYFFVEDRGEFCTEDFYFCKRAHEVGIQTWCDPTVKVLHQGDFLY